LHVFFQKAERYNLSEELEEGSCIEYVQVEGRVKPFGMYPVHQMFKMYQIYSDVWIFYLILLVDGNKSCVSCHNLKFKFILTRNVEAFYEDTNEDGIFLEYFCWEGGGCNLHNTI